MAKSLRSKSKRAFRRIKREDPKSDYAIRDKIRLQRLNDKLKVLTPAEYSDQEEEVDDEDVMEEDGVDQAEASSSSKPTTSTTADSTKDTMAVDESEAANATPGKVSTSGPRQNSNAQWRKAKGIPSRTKTEKNSTTFGKRKSYKSTGKAPKGGRRKK